MTKSHAKIAKSLEKETKQFLIYIKALVDLEEFVAQTAKVTKNEEVTLNPIDTKAYNAMKQRLRKYNKGFEAAIENYKKVNYHSELPLRRTRVLNCCV
jgi:hypothetical protein